MNYRKYYEHFTNKKIPKGFDIHHIDGDKSNNVIQNLVALPRSLHNKYHDLRARHSYNLENISLDVAKSLEMVGNNQWHYSRLKRLIDVQSICEQWVLFRDKLIGYPITWDVNEYNEVLNEIGDGEEIVC